MAEIYVQPLGFLDLNICSLSLSCRVRLTYSSTLKFMRLGYFVVSITLLHIRYGDPDPVTSTILISDLMTQTTFPSIFLAFW